jgi:hypothetical protein
MWIVAVARSAVQPARRCSGGIGGESGAVAASVCQSLEDHVVELRR